jgi:hypothetical protein
MAGDVNAFICQDHSDENDVEESVENENNPQFQTPPISHCCFELSIMVAENKFRRNGLAQEACQLMIHYILQRIDAEAEFIAKIGANNRASISLFTGRLGFERHTFSEVFQLITLKLANQNARKLAMKGNGMATTYTEELRIEPYAE